MKRGLRQAQSGFTMIELIMVIVILGVLSAFALPKFANLTSDAEVAALEGALAAIKSGSGIVRAAYLANGSSDPTLEGTTFTMVSGYLDSDNIDEAAGFSCGDPAAVDEAADFDCFDVGGTATVVVVEGSAMAEDDTCIKFTEGTPPTIIVGDLNVTTDDCA